MAEEGVDITMTYNTTNVTENLIHVGWPLQITYEDAVILTTDAKRRAAGGLGRNTLLVMKLMDSPSPQQQMAILLQITGSAPLPTQSEIEYTYHDMHSRGHESLDNVTNEQMSYSALKCDILGMIDFQGNFLGADSYLDASPHNYAVYAMPFTGTGLSLDNVINSGITKKNSAFEIGLMRQSESLSNLQSNEKEGGGPGVLVSIDDFVGTRTAIFGKTRTGKSNTVKIIAESVLTTHPEVGQLIFDVNGEYANRNQQDNTSLYHKYMDRCITYSFNEDLSEGKLQLKADFYAYPKDSKLMLSNLLESELTSIPDYVSGFLESDVPSLKEYELNEDDDYSMRNRNGRRILIYWMILKRAGFPPNMDIQKKIIDMANTCRISLKSRQIIYDILAEMDEKRKPKSNKNTSLDAVWNGGEGSSVDMPASSLNDDEIAILLQPHLNSLEDVESEWKFIGKFVGHEGTQRLKSSNNVDITKNTNGLTTTSSKWLFTENDEHMLKFLSPGTRSGPKKLTRFLKYHEAGGQDVSGNILAALEDGKTVILDLSASQPAILDYFSRKYTEDIFHLQEEKFTNNLQGNTIQMYMEEAHEIFPDKPINNKHEIDIYMRVAKEGAKFNIGMIYSTQSVTMVSRELLAQTENFFISHMSSQHETDELVKNNILFKNYTRDILYTRTTGLLRLLTRSHRFVIPVQIHKFGPDSAPAFKGGDL